MLCKWNFYLFFSKIPQNAADFLKIKQIDVKLLVNFLCSFFMKNNCCVRLYFYYIKVIIF